MIERAIERIEHIIKRKLTGTEIFIVGMAYQDGYIDCLKSERGEENESD